MRTLSEQQQRRGSAPSTRNTEAWCTSDSQRSPSTTHYRIASILLSSTATDNSAVKHGSVASTIRPNSRLADTSRPRYAQQDATAVHRAQSVRRATPGLLRLAQPPASGERT